MRKVAIGRKSDRISGVVGDRGPREVSTQSTPTRRPKLAAQPRRARGQSPAVIVSARKSESEVWRIRERRRKARDVAGRRWRLAGRWSKSPWAPGAVKPGETTVGRFPGGVRRVGGSRLAMPRAGRPSASAGLRAAIMGGAGRSSVGNDCRRVEMSVQS